MFGDDEDAVARVYTRTMGTEQGVPAQIIRYQLTNHIHSTSMELDEQANIASYEEYTPFGSTSYYAVDNELEIPKIRRWNNKERDDESGFYYFGARYYAPWITRWINADPGGFVDGLNVFSYVSNNPIKNKDPTGNFSEEVEVFLDELIPYAYKVKDKASLGKNIQKDHTIAQNLLKKILGPIFQKLYDKEKDLTVAVETGKGEWHTIKSVLERAIREKIVAGDITELNEVVYETVNVLKSANVEVGRAAELISSQYIGILDQLGNMFSQLKPDQAGELFQLMESGDDAKLIQRVEEFAQESKAALDPEKARAFAEGQNQLTRILKGASQEEGVIQKGEQVLENLVEGAKPILEKGAEVAAESGGGKLFARGGGIALGVLFFMLAKNDDQRVDAAISGTAGVLMEGPHVAKALGGGMMVGQGLESVFNVSDVSMHAGLWANQKMRENGFKEDAANAVGLYVTAEMTIPAIPIAIGKKVAPLAQKAGKGLRNFHW
jgi:RHS repeat-associated protein